MTDYVTGAGGGDLPAVMTVTAGSFANSGGITYPNAGGAESAGVVEDVGTGARVGARLASSGSGQYCGPCIRASNSTQKRAQIDANTSDGLYVGTRDAAGASVWQDGPFTCPVVTTIIELEDSGDDLKWLNGGALQDTYTGRLSGYADTYGGGGGYSNGTGTGFDLIRTTPGGSPPASAQKGRKTLLGAGG